MESECDAFVALVPLESVTLAGCPICQAHLIQALEKA